MSDLQQKLHDLHLQLGEAHRLDPNDRAMLETVLGDLRRGLSGPCWTRWPKPESRYSLQVIVIKEYLIK